MPLYVHMHILSVGVEVSKSRKKHIRLWKQEKNNIKKIHIRVDLSLELQNKK